MRLLVGVLAVLAAHCHAQNRPIDRMPPILRQMAMASRTLRYSGVRIVEFRKGPERSSHTEHVWRDGIRTRIEFPQGSPLAGQVIVEDDEERQQFFPGPNEIHVMPPRREEAAMRIGQLIRDLGPRADIKVLDGDKVAGLATKMVAIIDPAGNIIQKLWVNPRTGLLLKRELFDPVGTRVGFFEFREVNLQPEFRPDDFRIKRQGAKVLHPRDLLRRIARQAGFTPLSLQDNDKMRLDETRLIKIGEDSVLVQTFQTEKGPVSLFITRGDFDGQKFARMARADRFNVCVWDQDGKRLALIGSQDEALLRRMSRQVADR